jgi:kynureninase
MLYYGIDSDPLDPPSIYLCGNSLGVQPKSVKKYIDAFLRSWAMKGVTGHFDALTDTPFPTYLDADTAGSMLLAPLVGASPSEVALMGTLTANLHLLLASFYRPTKERFKIIMEGRAFPSDHVSAPIIISAI